MTRTSVLLDRRVLRKARRVLGAATDAEAVRQALALVAETNDFWTFMDRARGTLKPGSIRV